ncbi:thioredoxin domain-containing protein [Planctomicrobium piriforme]|uniref:Thioredoxin n=1 Tax=Planctomicrobium piriforme TaxID=1576369 RepID=A0A1I3AUI0_9PLAN|nr:thioredoxin domain-containing protein [Planctomicrobium piriforme]SFH53446.1 thioredoxin [Planctomicrobium piriforme]
MTRVTALAALACLINVTAAYSQESRGIVYDFSATWCGPCQQVAPIVEKLQREGLPIRKVDIDQQRDLASKYSVQQIPTFVLVIDGKEADRTTGRLTEADLRRMIARIPANAPAGSDNIASPSPRQGLIPIDLGEPAPMTRPEPARPAREETRIAEAEPKKGFRDMLPFGRKDKPAEEPAVVRGNDSALNSASTPTSDESIDPMESSVRIRVITNGRIDLGSGTVISSKPGITQILTCAHIFKEFTDDSRIEVDVFDHGRATQFLARLMKFDAASDLGLISIPTTTPLRATKVAAATGNPKVGEPVAAIGCSGGDEPTRQQSRVTDIDKYEGPHNLLCNGVPVRGRSGGGLFNRHGEIVGVCSAADEQEQRGFYSGLLAIHKLLDQVSLTHLYAPPAAAPEVPAQSFASTAAPAARPFDSAPASPFAAVSAPEPSASAPAAAMAANVAGTTPLDVHAGDAEVVVIIRDRSQTQAPNRVVILHQASPKFMSYLSGELQDGAMDTNLLGALEATDEMPVVSRSTRTPAIPVSAARVSSEVGKQVLQPTTLSQPMVPQKYSRSAQRDAAVVR